LASKLALAGQERVKRDFRPEHIWEALCEEYLRLLQTRGLPLPGMPCLEMNSGSGAPLPLGER
jgi:hypothetical protein